MGPAASTSARAPANATLWRAVYPASPLGWRFPVMRQVWVVSLPRRAAFPALRVVSLVFAFDTSHFTRPELQRPTFSCLVIAPVQKLAVRSRRFKHARPPRTLPVPSTGSRRFPWYRARVLLALVHGAQDASIDPCSQSKSGRTPRLIYYHRRPSRLATPSLSRPPPPLPPPPPPRPCPAVPASIRSASRSFALSRPSASPASPPLASRVARHVLPSAVPRARSACPAPAPPPLLPCARIAAIARCSLHPCTTFICTVSLHCVGPRSSPFLRLSLVSL